MNFKLKINKLSLGLLLFLLAHTLNAQFTYSVPPAPWPESLGNHRAVLQVKQTGDSICLDFAWRRHDPDPAGKKFLIISQETGDTIPIIQRLEVNQEKCKLVFGPVKKPGTYYFYYLPYHVQEGWGFYSQDYLRSKNEQPRTKLNVRLQVQEKSLAKLRHADIDRVEARTEFDSFFPMEVIALRSEKDRLTSQSKDPVLIFVEDRSSPIRMQDNIPFKWIQDGPSSHFQGQASKNEYYTFQVGLWTVGTALDDINIQYDQTPEAFNGITCFNKEGVDPYGTPFTKTITVPQDRVQALWFGLDLPEDIAPGTYDGSFLLSFQTDRAIKPVRIRYTIEVTDLLLPDRGDNEPWRHSRLRWLNSTVGIDNQPVAPYGPIRSSGEKLFNTTRIELQKASSGLPENITTTIPVLNKEISFSLINGEKSISFRYEKPVSQLSAAGKFQWTNSWHSDQVDALMESSLESDGYQRYTINLQIKEPIQLSDILLEIPFRKEVADYMMGMNLPGCAVPENHRTGWLKPQDAFWVGNTHGGIWCEIRGSSYHGPLLNLYKPGHPRPWYNDDKGYLSIAKTESATVASVGTGPITLYPGEKWIFSFALLPTPVKKLNPADQFTNRYYHSGAAPKDVEAEIKNGVKVVNIHHANQFNPFINYPFIAVDELRSIVDQYHASGLKVKIYYTIRELTNHVTEIWALRSLGDEIFRDGNGGGYMWLREHFVSDYHPQWYQHFDQVSPDASILTAATASRWYNYYIEGLRWLIQNQDIDGLYLDDVSFDRRILKRMRKVMEETKPGCLIDLHSNTGFSIGPAIQYTDFFPYVDKLWFGESFQYNNMSPENWLVEVSGIPFGLMGDMLHGGGNRWLGMLFGMTVRLPWTSEGNTADPRPIWNFWDDFGIAQANMIGFWEDTLPFKIIESNTNAEARQVKATMYQRSDEFILAIANFSDHRKSVHIEYFWDQLGLKPEHCEFLIPEIRNFQVGQSIKEHEDIQIDSKKGQIIWVKSVK